MSQLGQLTLYAYNSFFSPQSYIYVLYKLETDFFHCELSIVIVFDSTVFEYYSIRIVYCRLHEYNCCQHVRSRAR